jgi:hypothetical protein
MKNAGVSVILFYVGCFLLRAEDYSLSFLQTDGGFEFFAMQSSKTGHVHGKFPRHQKPYLLPKPELSVTLDLDFFGKTPVHHLYTCFGFATFALNGLFFKIESDRTVSLWGGNAYDRVFIYNKNNLNLRLAFEHFKGSVWCRLKGEDFKQIIIKKVNK